MNRTTKIKSKLKDIDKLSDQLGANDDLLSARSELLKQYHDIQSVETRESIQKAKIKWATEGDENSKFFHGMINRKRANLAVKDVMIEGEWVDDPSKVKDEFRDYFASRFCDPGIRHAVEWFFHHASFLVGCNSSFIALISKTLNPKSVGEYRPISLIGSIYKVVTKILANRLSTVKIDSSMTLSHLFYADDAVFIGELGANDDLLSARSELLEQYHDIQSVETRES
nr:RNA-directed DNA polymerase, eukaryota [Tanacetum cinerariifolium]